MKARNRFVGGDRKNLFRSLDRASRVVAPRSVNHVSQLPPARDNGGRIMYVRGTTNTFYKSNGTAWTAI